MTNPAWPPAPSNQHGNASNSAHRLASARSPELLAPQFRHRYRRSPEAVFPFRTSNRLQIKHSRDIQALQPPEAAEILWRDVGAEFGLLTATELSLLIGDGTPDPGMVNGLFREGRLIAMHRAGQVLFPGFQIQRGTGIVWTAIRDLRRTAGSVGRSDRSLISWLVTPSGYLGGARPVNLLDDPERILRAARKAFNASM